ncbi:MAG: hypothetical protein SGJ27_10375 [Candidatus Melainabacteria bacterium]|nr:hypothetical protein [Candidatus Melainabacteria bacterium]
MPELPDEMNDAGTEYGDKRENDESENQLVANFLPRFSTVDEQFREIDHALPLF